MENFKLDFKRLHSNEVSGRFLMLLPPQTSPTGKDTVSLVSLVDFSVVPGKVLSKIVVIQYRNMEKIKKKGII